MTACRALLIIWIGVTLCAALPAHASAQPQAAAERASWSMRLSAGLGAGMRAFDLPKEGRIDQMRSGLFPAAELGFGLDYLASERFVLALLGSYQSSVGLRIDERHTDSSEHPRDARSHRLELALAPTLRFDAQGRWALSAPIGYAVSDLYAVGHLETPSYVLGGPYARIELQITLWQRLRLRLGPEAQWIVQVGDELVARHVARSGLGIGGVAALAVMLDQHWSVDATYRELRCWLDSSESGSFIDVTRFMTARVTGTL